MRRWFSALSLRRKLATLSALPLLAAMLLALLVFVTNQVVVLRTAQLEQLESLASIAAKSVHAALAFGDHKAAGEWTGSLEESAMIRKVTDVTALFSERASQKGVTLSAQVDADVPEALLGDPLRLRQVLGNLVSNGIKFTPQGGVTLRVGRSNDAAAVAGAVIVRVEVQDTGVGIDAQARNKLFQPFSQADGSMARRFGGTGLGLAICQRLVTLMGGQIGLTDAPERGALFWFTVPLGVGAAADVRVASIDVPSEINRVTARVLLAEDNPVNTELALAMLEDLVTESVHAGDGEEALRKATAGDFDLILMDCQMPELDGLEATRRIRLWEASLPGRERVPIIALTANAMLGDRERCLAAGMDDYLSKPFRQDTLATMLTRWLKRGLPPQAVTIAVPLDSERRIVAPVRVHGADQGSAPRAPPSFDRAAFQKSLPAGLGTDSPLACRLMQLFLSESAKLLAEIERTAAAADAQATYRTAHSLKSSSASVGASAVSAIAREIEALGRAGQTSALVEQSARLRLEYERFCAGAAIRDILASETGKPSAAAA